VRAVDPGIGDRVVIQPVGPFARLSRSARTGEVDALDLANDRARVLLDRRQVAVPYAALRVATDDPDEDLWRRYRDGLVSTGLSFNGISKRDFMAGLAAAA